MSNGKKLFVLSVLLVVLASLSLALLHIKNIEKEILEEDRIKGQTSAVKDEPEVEFHGETMINLSATLTQKIDVYSYRDKIIDKSINLIKDVVDKYLSDGVVITDATVINLERLNTGTAGLYDAVDIFNVEFLLTTSNNEKINDKSNYMLFYSRWDEDGEGTYYLNSLTEEEIQNKYSTFAHIYSDDVYIAACMIERDLFLERTEKNYESDLPDLAYKKAVAYSKTLQNKPRVINIYLTDQNQNQRKYIFYTDKENEFIEINYIYFDNSELWTFLYATHIKKATN